MSDDPVVIVADHRGMDLIRDVAEIVVRVGSPVVVLDDPLRNGRLAEALTRAMKFALEAEPVRRIPKHDLMNRPPKSPRRWQR